MPDERDSPSASTRRPGLRPLLVTVLMVASGWCLRVVQLPAGPEGWDAVDFLFALESYDLARFEPHFPGYPLYVLAGRAAVALGVAPGLAYRHVNAIAGALLPVALLLLLPSRTLRGAWRFVAPVAASLSPTLLLASVRIESDLPGLVTLLFGFAAGRAGRSRFSGALAAAALGIRPGLLPLVAGLAGWHAVEAPPRDRWRRSRRFATALVVGVSLWWTPQVILAGPAAYMREAASFVAGHFGDWGGTALTEDAPFARLATILGKLAQGLGAGRHPLGFAGVAFVGLGAALLLSRGPRPRNVWLAWVALPQALTLLLLQNPERSRHYYPLLLALLVGAAPGWQRAGALVRGVGLLLAALLALEGVWLLRERAATEPPPLRAVRQVLARARPDTWIFCGETWRLFHYADPLGTAVVRRARDLRGVTREINGLPGSPVEVLVFSEVEGQEGAPALSARGNPLIYDAPAVDVYVYHTVTRSRDETVSLVPGGEAGVRTQ